MLALAQARFEFTGFAHLIHSALLAPEAYGQTPGTSPALRATRSRCFRSTTGVRSLVREADLARSARYWDAYAHAFDAIYSGRKNPFNRQLDRWLRKDMYQRFDWVLERAGDVRGATVCDIGCGSGRFANALAQRGAAQVTGLDISPRMLSLACDLVQREGVAERCRFLHADPLTWETVEQFDVTLAVGFWDYMADPEPRLRIVRRLTSRLFLSTWPRVWTWRMPIRRVRLGILGCPVYFYRRSQLKGLLEAAGFEISRLDVIGQLYCVEARPV